CDAIDDDCDGTNDEDYAPVATSCGTGACASTGVTSCVSGSVVDSCTTGTPAANDATCDSVDDDCDGTADEDYVSAATSCGVGACASIGATSCVSGSVVDSCTAGTPAASDATCDAIDDDCDGANDEDYASIATSCGIGACASSGATSCVSGSVIDSCSVGTPAASDATCDAVDDDCDGTNDEDYVSSPTACGVGACAATGSTSCISGSVLDSCTAGTPAANDATCDGIDDDCDGANDEDFTPLCAGTSVATCVAGALSLSACDDGDSCNGSETCESAQCVAGSPPLLEDGNPCTLDTCDPTTGVAHAPSPAGTSCADDDLCNGAESCDGAGACTPATPLPTDDGNACTADACDPVAGVIHVSLPEGTLCEDADPCNGIETCNGAGVCVPGPLPVSGPCVLTAPTARIFVDEERDVSSVRQGASLVGYTGPSAPSLTDSGFTWTISFASSAVPTAILDLTGEEVVVPARVRFTGAAAPSGVRHFEIWASATGTADADFVRVLSGEASSDPNRPYDYPLEPASARYLKIVILDDWGGRARRGYINRLTVWTRPRSGGAISLSDTGVAVTATAGANPRRATDYDPETEWTTFGTGAPIAGQRLTIDLPGTDWELIDRVRLRGRPRNSNQLRGFQIWTSSTTDDPAAFTHVLSSEVPDADPAADYWYFFPPIRARYVQLRTVSNYGSSQAVSLSGLTVVTAHEGGLTLPLTNRTLAGELPIVGYRWRFGDGSYSTEEHPTHTYRAPGTYLVTLQAIDTYGSSTVDSFYYTAHVPPTARFAQSPDPVSQGQTLSLTDASFGDRPILEAALTADGYPILLANIAGTRYTGSPGFRHDWVMDRSGALRVRAEAIDDRLLRGVTDVVIPVGNVVPTVDAGADQTLVWGQPWSPIPAPIVTDAAGGAETFALTCHWDFGDGGTADSAAPCRGDNVYASHAWSTPGRYVATVTATDPVGGQGSDSFVVEVTRRETAIVLAPVTSTTGLQTVVADLADRYDAGTPIAGRSLRFVLGAQSVVAITDASGRATATLDFGPGGPAQVQVTFDGDSLYFPSSGDGAFPETLRPSYPGNCGTDYLLAIPNPCMDDGRCPLPQRGDEEGYRHFLYFTAEAHTAVDVEAGGVGWNGRVAVDESGIAILELPPLVAVQSSGAARPETIRVHSDRLVCVHGLAFFGEGSDGYLALPINSLGTDYVVASYSGVAREGFGRTYVSQLTVAATQDATSVTIVPTYAVRSGPGTPSAQREPAGVPFTITLDAGEVMQLRADDRVLPEAGALHQYDLTGTTIRASAPVSVSSGHMTIFVPPGIDAANYLVEQLPPVDALGTEHIVAPFARRGSGSRVRVVAAHPATQVRLDGTLVATIDVGQYHELDLTSAAPHAIVTSEPALVVQYAKGLNAESSPTGAIGDPTMVVVVPTTQYDNAQRVSTVPDTVDYQYEHYLSLVVPTAEVGGVRIDGAPVSAPFTPVAGTSWATAQILVEQGVHEIAHVRPTVPIGVSIYGWAEYDAYGYPARMRLIPLAGGCTPSTTGSGDGADNDCDGRVDEELSDGLDDDGDGLVDEDLYYEGAAPVNLPPVAYDRVDTLREDAPKAIALSAFDPNGDALTYEILASVSQGTLSGTAPSLIYAPRADYFGPDAFTYRACDASECSEPATFVLDVRPENDTPRIAMGALYTAVEDELFELALVATDVEDDPIAWSVVDAPAGVGIEAERALFYWTPPSRFANMTVPVTLRASDGAASVDVGFGIHVLNRPDAPVIGSRPVTIARWGTSYVYDAEATDPDPGEVFAWFLLNGPTGLSLDPLTGVVTWSPTLADVGRHAVELIVQDSTGLLSQPQRYVLEVIGDATAPSVSVTVTPDALLPGEAATVRVVATDDDAASIETTTIGADTIVLDASGQGTWTAGSPGRYTAQTSAVDPSGNRASATQLVRVLDASDTDAPVVELIAPAANDVLTYLHDVVGTVRDPHLHRWTVDLREADAEDAYRTLLEGTTEVEAATLGVLDTTQLRNGVHQLRLRAEDVNGRVSEDVRPIRIDGGAKLGVVTLSFVDLVVRDFGIPLAVVRTYDSRDTRQGDFGIGWRLDLRGGSVRHNYPTGEGFAVFTREGDFVPCQRTEDQMGHVTEVRLSDDEWYLFRPVILDPAPIAGSCGGHVSFEQVDGTRPGATLLIAGSELDTLVRATANTVISSGSFVPWADLYQIEGGGVDVYQPQQFQLRLADGRVFDLDGARGITRVQDANGNSLFVTDEGLIHSSGRYVQFVKDARGRISQILDQAGRSVGYDYDAQGNLASFLDPAGGTTRYEYNAPRFPHHLTDIVDPRGVRVAAFEYQADGRLRELCDADGVCTQSEYDLGAQSMTRFDGLRRPTQYAYDRRGNISRIADPLGNLTYLWYVPEDARYGRGDQLARRDDPDGSSTLYYHDEYNNLIAEVGPYREGVEDPAPWTTRWTRDRAGRPLTQTLPSGGTYFHEYDANGNELFVRDDEGNGISARTDDAQGGLQTYTDRFGTETYERDDRGLPTRMTEPDGNVTLLEHDTDGNVTRLERGGIVQRFRYDALGRRTFADYGNGATVQYEHDAAGDWRA
ncbi:MAG: PKD domain-containing protein, partial [Sandaracinaceae bacterium]|nr:PKD domain-containing protein [Sandaracinaceae bacterium]